ncbi:MAG: hypothetical protein IKP08_00400 [Bacteroidales bacterium]|nr:hypothetical protein [Bacteroidales bacterium]
MNKGFVVLMIVAIVLFLVEIALWIFNVISFSVIDAGTFISVSVAILAIIVTIVIGWQVVNILDFKKKQEELEFQQKKININQNLQDSQQKTIVETQQLLAESQKALAIQQKELQEDLSTGIKFVLRMSIIPGYLDGNKFVDALNTLFIALNDLMSLNKLQGFEKNVDVVIILINEYVSKCSESDMLTLWTRIKDTDEKIRNAKNFSMISEKYEDIIKRIKKS